MSRYNCFLLCMICTRKDPSIDLMICKLVSIRLIDLVSNIKHCLAKDWVGQFVKLKQFAAVSRFINWTSKNVNFLQSPLRLINARIFIQHYAESFGIKTMDIWNERTNPKNFWSIAALRFYIAILITNRP